MAKTKPRQPVRRLAEAMDSITSEEVLDLAYAWLCGRRREAPFWHDVWHLRWRWDDLKPTLRQRLLDGSFRLGPTRIVRTDDEAVEAWSARDAIVLKAVAIVLGRTLDGRVGDGCFSCAGAGGAKRAVREVEAARPDHSFVFRSDVRNYYASLKPDVVYGAVRRHVRDPRVLDLLWRYLHRAVWADGEYRLVRQGIPRGCPLSPLLGALSLTGVEEEARRRGLFVARFMDDWVVLAETRWQLRRAVRAIRRLIAGLGLELAPEKTFVGRISRGFDFLGYRFGPGGIGVAEKTVERFVERVNRLYEQGADEVRIGEYVRRWSGWVRGGLGFEVRGVGSVLRMLNLADGVPGS